MGLKTGKINEFVDLETLNKMLRALRKVPTITVERDHTAKTVLAYHSGGKELFRGMQWGPARTKCLWSISYHPRLFM